jgi:hypothetical protein
VGHTRLGPRTLVVTSERKALQHPGLPAADHANVYVLDDNVYA